MISFFEREKRDKEIIIAVMQSLKANYIAQEAVKQHPALSELNPSSLNTIRIVSFFLKGKYIFCRQFSEWEPVDIKWII